MSGVGEALRRRVRRVRGHVGRVRSGGRRRAQRVRVLWRFPKSGVGAEIGVWKGDFSTYLLRVTRPARLHLIDPWHFETDPDDSRVGQRAKSQQNMDAMHDHVGQRFARQIAGGTVVVHRARSDEVAPTLEPLDWVYIDGNHTYQGVLDDLTAYYALLRPGGALAGDDYGMPGWWGDGVREAVNEFVARNGCQLTVTGHQFLIRKPG
jgi:Methyltransferase domain